MNVYSASQRAHNSLQLYAHMYAAIHSFRLGGERYGGQYGNGVSAGSAPGGSGVRAVFKIIEIMV